MRHFDQQAGQPAYHVAQEPVSTERPYHFCARLLFLEGRPVVSKLNPVHIGADVLTQLQNDLAAEQVAVKGYNDAIALAVQVSDNGTRAMLESILKDEEEHLDWVETQLEQIQQMGIQFYLVEKVG